MKFESYIRTLFLAERDFLKTFIEPPEIHKMYLDICDFMEINEAQMSDSIKKIFYDYDEMQNDYLGECEYNAYEQGFKAGFKFATEIYKSELSPKSND